MNTNEAAEIFAMADYLQNANIIKLQQAARMGGLRWKSGTPGYDKKGIIEKLSYTPSQMRATVAVLKNMDKGEFAPKPTHYNFMDDVKAESGDVVTPYVKPPIISEIIPANAPHSADIAKLQRDIETVGNIVQGIRSDYVTTAQARKIAFDYVNPLSQSIETLKAKIIELEKQKPLQFIIDKKESPIISGQHPRFPDLIKYLQINRRVILTGSAGTGKSMAVKKAAEVLGLTFYLQTPVTQSHELLGYRDAGGVFHESPLFQAYTKGGLILMDEADASAPDAMLCANPIFDGNGFAMFGDGKMHQQHPDFLAVLNMNTDGTGATMKHAGRNPLDGATLARFGVRIHWHVAANIELSMAAGQTAWLAVIHAVRALLEARSIQEENATPRQTKTGAMLLANGLDRKTIIVDILKWGATAEIWRDIESLPAVRSFLQGV